MTSRPVQLGVENEAERWVFELELGAGRNSAWRQLLERFLVPR